jgi:hypothetical protein
MLEVRQNPYQCTPAMEHLMVIWKKIRQNNPSLNSYVLRLVLSSVIVAMTALNLHRELLQEQTYTEKKSTLGLQ